MPRLFFISIYSGAATPTEAAAVGFAFSLFVTTFVLRTMTWELFKEAVIEAAITTVAVLLIVAAAKVFGKAIALYRLPQDVATFLTANFSVAWTFLLMVSGVLLVMGCFLEAISMLLLMVPVLQPALPALGIDNVWFGIFFTIMIECALITPPVGLNLFVIQSIARTGLREVASGSVAFVVMLLLALIVIYFVPGIAMWLVDVNRGAGDARRLGLSTLLAPALDRRRDAHRLAVLGDRAPGDVDAFRPRMSTSLSSDRMSSGLSASISVLMRWRTASDGVRLAVARPRRSPR